MLPALAKGGLVIYLGTILCYGSLLHYVLEERRDFESRRFSAVREFAKRSDLWDEWRTIRNKDEEDSADKALAFYEENKNAMDEGSSILWTGYFTYYKDRKSVGEGNRQ